MTKDFVNNARRRFHTGKSKVLVSFKKLPRPTDTELEILRAIWANGVCTVREVLKTVNQGRTTEVGYTTVLKMLQVMTAKGLVERDESSRPQVYRARLSKEQTQVQLLRSLIERAFGGSAKQLVMQALSDREASDQELEQIEKVLDQIEGRKS